MTLSDIMRIRLYRTPFFYYFNIFFKPVTPSAVIFRTCTANISKSGLPETKKCAATMTAHEKILNNEGIAIPRNQSIVNPFRVSRKPSSELNSLFNVGEETPQPASAGN